MAIQGGWLDVQYFYFGLYLAHVVQTVSGCACRKRVLGVMAEIRVSGRAASHQTERTMLGDGGTSQRGSGSPSGTRGLPREQSAWFDAMCSRLAPLRPLDDRLSAVPQLLSSLQRYCYSHSQLCAVWGEVASLLVEPAAKARHSAYAVMDAINDTQPLAQIGTLRLEFLQTLRLVHSRSTEGAPVAGLHGASAVDHLGSSGAGDSTSPPGPGSLPDMPQRQVSILKLIKGGRRIDPFAEDVGHTLVEWLDATTDLPGYMQLLQDVVQGAFYSLGTATISYLVARVCELCDRGHSGRTHDRTLPAGVCLSFFDTVIRFGVVPKSCLLRLLVCLCRRAGRDDSTWEIMHNLLKSECGHQAFVAMLSILDSPSRYRYVRPALLTVCFHSADAHASCGRCLQLQRAARRRVLRQFFALGTCAAACVGTASALRCRAAFAVADAQLRAEATPAPRVCGVRGGAGRSSPGEEARPRACC